MALEVYTGRKYFSASLSNQYTDHLLVAYDYAVAPRVAFCTTDAVWGSSNGTEMTWAGYILYAGDTTSFRYSYVSNGTTTIYINNVNVHSNTGTQAGTVTLSGLTANNVYPVRVDSNASSLNLKWLGLSRTINYTAPPTFVSGNVLTAANMNTIRTCLAELEQSTVAPQSANVFQKQGDPGAGRGVGVTNSITVWRGFFYHTHDTLRYRYRYGVNTKTVTGSVYYAGNLVGGSSNATLDKTVSGTIDLSGEGLSVGTLYECIVKVGRSGTANELAAFMWLFEISEASNLAVTPPPVWAHGGMNITAANLNRYSTIINAIHPAAASPTAPLYYEEPAVKTPTGLRFYLQHRKKWLRYIPYANGKTCELSYGPNLKSEVDLPSATQTAQSYDLSQLPNLAPGDFYWLDDCIYAQEYDSSS